MSKVNAIVANDVQPAHRPGTPPTPSAAVPFYIPPIPTSPPTSASTPSPPPRVPSPLLFQLEHPYHRLSTITERTEFSTPPSRPLSPQNLPVLVNIPTDRPRPSPPGSRSPSPRLQPVSPQPFRPIIIGAPRHRRHRRRSRSRSPSSERTSSSGTRSDRSPRRSPRRPPQPPAAPQPPRRVRYSSNLETPIPVSYYPAEGRSQRESFVVPGPSSGPYPVYAPTRRRSRTRTSPPSSPYGSPQQPYDPYYSRPIPIVTPSQDRIRSWRDESLIPATDSPFSSQFFGDREWKQYVHPNGSLYWCSYDKLVVSDQQPHTGTMTLVEPLLQNIINLDDAHEWELFISSGLAHFVHHASRSMSGPSEMFHVFRARIEQAYSDIVMRLELEYYYWTFVQAHPNHVVLPQEAKYDAEEAILWSHADRSLFDSSNAPFEKEVAKEMFAILSHLDGLSRFTLKAWFIAAVMRSVVEERQACHYGTPVARNFRHMEKAEEVAEFQKFTSMRRALVWQVVTVITLRAPNSYLKRIINVDRSNGISTSRWRAFLRNLCAEWVDTNLLSTVLVSATTAMLTVPGLNPLAEVAAFCSILSSLGSVMCGMLLIFTHRGRMESTGRVAYLYFDYAKRMTGSPHSLAVLLSLPLVLTLWSIFWFVLSVASLAFKPGIPLVPAFWGRWLRYGTLALVGCLVVIVTIVGWFFRNRRENTSIPIQLPVPPGASAPPPYMPYLPPMVGPSMFYGNPLATPVSVPMMGPTFYSQPFSQVHQHSSSHHSRVSTATRRRRRSASSAVAAATFRPHSV